MRRVVNLCHVFVCSYVDAIRARLEELKDMLRQAVDEGDAEKCFKLEGLIAEHVAFLRKLIRSHSDAEKIVELQGILSDFISGETPRLPPNANAAEEKGLL